MKKGLVIVSKLFASMGYFTSIIFAIFALEAEGGVLSALCFISSAGIAVINLPILFPWPQRNSGRSASAARASLVFGICLSAVLFLAGILGASSLETWRAAFLIFGLTAALNLALVSTRAS